MLRHCCCYWANSSPAKRRRSRRSNVNCASRQSCRINLIASFQRAANARRDYLLPFVPLMNRTIKDLETGARLITEIEDEQRQNELSLYFSVFSGVAYNAADILELVGRNHMAVMELMKESWVYQHIVNKGRAEGELGAMPKLLSQHIVRRFPTVKVAKKIAQMHDVAQLQQLCLEFNEIQDAVALRKRLDEAIKAQNQ